MLYKKSGFFVSPKYASKSNSVTKVSASQFYSPTLLKRTQASLTPSPSFSVNIVQNRPFIDRTLFIKDFLDNRGVKVTSITRPPGFGKSFNMSMMQHFFASEVQGKSTKGLFDKTLIAEQDPEYLNHQGMYPVISFSFKEVNQNNLKSALQMLSKNIQNLYQEHHYLATSTKLSSYCKTKINKILTGDFDELRVAGSLLELSNYLYSHHQQSVMIFIDDYDIPLLSGYQHSYFKEIAKVVNQMMHACLKSNSSLCRGLLTGTFPFPKDDYGSLNNVVSYSVIDDNYNKYFGFTEQGYSSFEHDNFIKTFFQNTPPQLKQKLKSLLEGKEIEYLIEDQKTLNYLDGRINDNIGVSILLMMGYLTAVSTRFSDGDRICKLKISNSGIEEFLKIIGDTSVRVKSIADSPLEEYYKVALTPSIRKSLKEVDEINEEIHRCQLKINDNLRKVIQDKLCFSWTYNSNAIEGSKLSLEDTIFFLQEGLTVAGKQLQDFLDAKNHLQAIDYLYEAVKEQLPINTSFLCSLNARLLNGIDYLPSLDEQGNFIQKKVFPGKYRKEPNFDVAPVQVAPQIRDLCQWIDTNPKNYHNIIVAAIVHYNMVRIHPFQDRNGRGARLLMNAIMMRDKYYPCIIEVTKRQEYLNHLKTGDQGNLQPFTQFVIDAVKKTHETILAEINQFSSSLRFK